MIRNGGKLTKIRYTTSSSNTAGATGIYDTFDAYNARLSDLWPVLPTFSSNVTASTSTIYHNGNAVTITNTSKNITTNTTLYYTIETVSGPSGSFVGVISPYNNVQSGTFTQPAGATGIASISIYPLANYEPDPTRQPVQFKVNIRTTSFTGPIVGSSPVITIPTPIPTLQFLPYLAGTTQFDETQSAWYLSLTWANIGAANTVSQINYNITYSGTATTQDLLTTVATMSNDPETVSYDAFSAYIYGKKDYLTEGTESLTMTVKSPSNGWTIGTVSANIIDTSITPVTTITPSATTVEKGATIRFDVAIQNAQETTIYYVITGSAANKFSAQTGNFLLSAGGITLTVINNFNYTEADTTFQVQFRAQSTSGYLYGTSQVITVTTPAQPSATIVAIASMDEGTTNSFVVNTTNYSGNLDWNINERKVIQLPGYSTSLLTCQSATIVDNSTNAFSISNPGNVAAYATGIIGGTGVPVPSYANFFNSSNWLTVPYSNAFDFGSDNWTIEMWLKRFGDATDQFFYAHRENDDYGPFVLGLTTENTLYILASIGIGTWSMATGGNLVVPYNTWTHVAAVRNGSVFTTYVNGVQDYTRTGLSGAMATTTSRIAIGSGGATNGNNRYYGYISNLRVVKGSALYTSNFTPSTTALTRQDEAGPNTTVTIAPVVTDFFTANSGSITVANGGSGTITVKPRADTFTEGPETFRLTVSVPNNGGTLSTSDFIVNDTSTGTTELLDLYSFLSFKFVSGADDSNYVYGSTGNKTGDSLSTLLSKYNTTTYPWLKNTSYYNVVTAGIQLWTVPFTGVYRFKVAGARGGGWLYGTLPGGWGATLNGDVFLTRGTVLSIVVGKTGSASTASGSGGGGGGGTFVYTGSIGGTGLLFAAGGGGGSDDDGITAGQNAREDLCAGFNATGVRPDPTNGQGAAPAGSGGGTGTGWLSDSTSSGAGTRFLGGDGASSGGGGGFGGGGGDLDDGGGGGGYTGGTSSNVAGGGCGGSYYNPQRVNNYSWGGTNQVGTVANGFVEITAITTGATATITPTSSTITEGQSVTFNIVTTGFITGTLYYYLLTNTGSISTTEFSNTTNTLAGSVTITDSTGQVTYTYRNDAYTEGSEAVSLLVYYNTGGIRYTMGTSSQVTISDSSTGGSAQFTFSDVIKSNGNNNYEVSTSPLGQLNVGSRGWTILRETTTATADSYFSIPLPFTFKINNANFTNVLINENAWMVFGTVGSTLSSGFVLSTAASAVPYNKLVFSGGNNTMQRLFYRVDGQNRFVLIRYEGNAATSGTEGSPGIIAEIKLLNPQFTGGMSMIELKYQTNRAVTATSHKTSLSSPSDYYTYYDYPFVNNQYNLVFYANNTEATNWSFTGSYNNPATVVL